MLALNVVKKIVPFKMIFRAHDPLPGFYIIKSFFCFSATGDKFTFSAPRGGHVLVPDGKNVKKWHDKWLWVNVD